MDDRIFDVSKGSKRAILCGADIRSHIAASIHIPQSSASVTSASCSAAEGRSRQKTVSLPLLHHVNERFHPYPFQL